MFSYSKEIGWNNIYGILFTIVAGVSSSLLYATVKLLTAGIPANQVVLAYKIMVVLLLLPMMIKRKFDFHDVKNFKLYVIGALLSSSATLLLMNSLKYISLVNATSLGYLEKIIISFWGIAFFQERRHLFKVVSIVIGFLGAVLVSGPVFLDEQGSSYQLEEGYILLFSSIVIWSLYCLVVKILSAGKEDKTISFTFYNALFTMLFTMPVTLVDWGGYKFMGIYWPRPQGLLIDYQLEIITQNIGSLIIIALCYLLRTIFSFQSFKYGELSVIMPFSYSKVVFSGILGLVLFNERPGMHEYIGYFMIIMSGIIMFASKPKNL